MKKNIYMTSFYVYNVGEIHKIETVKDIQSIMGNPNED